MGASLADVVVPIVGFRNPDDMKHCLRALARMDAAPTFDVFVAENGGPAAMDALVATLDAGDPAWTAAPDTKPPVTPDHGVWKRSYRLAGRPEGSGFVHVAESSENLGYAGGINVWLRPLLAAAGWSAAWILNPDTEPRPDALAELAASSASRKKGMVGSVIVRDDDPDVIAMRGLQWQKWIGRSVAIDRYASASIAPDVAALDATLDAPSGASMYVTRSLIERIGLMYDPYFLYAEDFEWGVRAKRLGELGHAPKSVVLHKYGTTIGSSDDKAGRSPLAVYLGARNAVIFSRRNFPAFVLPAVAMQLVQACRYLIAGAPANFRFALQGIVAGCLGETGRPDPLPGAPAGAPTKTKEQAPSLSR
jgi:N-acetylglucosaminyl-diphospho-decaprenol L-rhamnosyltransferase